MIEQTTLILDRGDLSRLLPIGECMNAVEHAFKLYAEGKAKPPKVLSLHSEHGGFHIKAGMMDLGRSYFVAKINGNFPGNPLQNGLPSIQGVVVVCDAKNGRLLSLMDSAELTITRTGAATGVAAKYLSLPDATTITIFGCGNQGRISLEAIQQVRNIKKVFAFDTNESQAQNLAADFSQSLEVVPVSYSEIDAALRQSQVCITCTPSKSPFLRAAQIPPGTFVAAVGADNEEKQELFTDLLANNKIVTDITDQCAAFGELHHAVRSNLLTKADVHAELGEVIAGIKPGRESEDEIIIFDSTGTALQDVIAASIVYEKAVQENLGIKLNFSEQELASAIQG